MAALASQFQSGGGRALDGLVQSDALRGRCGRELRRVCRGLVQCSQRFGHLRSVGVAVGPLLFQGFFEEGCESRIETGALDNLRNPQGGQGASR